ncbi:hypothetical protein [Janibacter limosus]|uniref:hypothetical protein n=1 Tax=Janibacter limosus TaxID=53458 RepID=UPI000A6C4B11|nr:hypothetical protein [Janibacter limosus]
MIAARTMVTAGVIAATGLLASACGGQAESEESATSPLPSKDAGEVQVAEVFRDYWRLSNEANPSEPPSTELKAVLGAESYERQAESAKVFPAVTVRGKDELTASETRTSSDTKATVEVCYEVHRQLIAKKAYDNGTETVPAGTNLRTDRNGKPIKDGTEMVNLITFERATTSSDWQVSATEVGYKSTCDLDKEAS